MAVDPNNRIAKSAVKLDADAPAEIGCGNEEGLAIPADGGVGEIPANGLVAVAVAAPAVKRQFHNPVVRQIERPPGTVVEIGRRRPVAIAGLGEIGEKTHSGIEILLHIRRVAESEAPAGVHEQPFAKGRCGGGFLPDLGGHRRRRGRDQESDGCKDKDMQELFFHFFLNDYLPVSAAKKLLPGSRRCTLKAARE